MINYFCKYKVNQQDETEVPMFLFDFVKYLEENFDEYNT